MNDNQILIVHIAEECTILWARFGGTALFHSSVIMHSLKKKIVSDFGKIQQLCTFQNLH